MERLVVALTVLILTTISALAEGSQKQSKIWTPQALPTYAEVSSGYMYMGLLGGYSTLNDDFEEGTWRVGLNVGYLAKMKSLGLGLEAEALRHFDDNIEQNNELDNWDFSVRGRVGLFMSPTFMPYVTGGYSWRLNDNSVVYGLGAELFTNERMSVRFEALKYAGDDETTDFRGGVYFRF